jgi:hypothetical protein
LLAKVWGVPMTGRPVAVSAMRLDPPYTKTPGRARYLITLQCGCSWWEDYPVEAVPPRVGDPASCYNPNHSDVRTRITPREMAVAADR